MANNAISTIRNLCARIDGHLKQFADEDNTPMDPDDYVGARVERKKRQNITRAAMAGAGVAATAAAVANRDKIKAAATDAYGRYAPKAKDAATDAYGKARGAVADAAGKAKGAATDAYGRYAPKVKEAANDAAFKGMRRTADGMDTTRKLLKKKLPAAGNAVEGMMKKGARFLRKKSMKFFDANTGRALAGKLVELHSRVRGLEV